MNDIEDLEEMMRSMNTRSDLGKSLMYYDLEFDIPYRTIKRQRFDDAMEVDENEFENEFKNEFKNENDRIKLGFIEYQNLENERLKKKEADSSREKRHRRHEKMKRRNLVREMKRQEEEQEEDYKRRERKRKRSSSKNFSREPEYIDLTQDDDDTDLNVLNSLNEMKNQPLENNRQLSKQQYYSLMKRYHPDKNSHSHDKEYFTKMTKIINRFKPNFGRRSRKSRSRRKSRK
jgi:hypothetical protein